jgi:signal transduction histidine kinase
MRTLYEASLFGAAGVRLEVDLPADPVFASVQPDAVKQIVFNLWKNAAQALPRGGVVRTAVHAHVNQNGTMHASIVIQDTGPGLPAAVLDSLYRPPPGAPGAPRADGRAGLGLSIVLGLVERLHGSISCLSKAGQGTTFTLLVPEPQRNPG